MRYVCAVVYWSVCLSFHFYISICVPVCLRSCAGLLLVAYLFCLVSLSCFIVQS